MMKKGKPVTLQRRQIRDCLIVIVLFFVLLLNTQRPRVASSLLVTSNAIFSEVAKTITLNGADLEIVRSVQTSSTSLCAGVTKAFQVALADNKILQQPLCVGIQKVFIKVLKDEKDILLQKGKSKDKKQILPQEKETQYDSTPYVIECTAYCPTGNPCYDEIWPQEGETVAGKKSWIGKKCNLYYMNENGNVGQKIGTYKFHDTGFGNDPDGDGIGSIETGERIDLYMEDYDRAMEWGEKYIYIEFLN